MCEFTKERLKEINNYNYRAYLIDGGILSDDKASREFDMKGLDCSGFVCHVLNKVFRTGYDEFGTKESTYICAAKNMAKNYADRFNGVFQKKIKKTKGSKFLPFDILSNTSCGHVVIVIGQCADGSIVAIESSIYSGVRLCIIKLHDDEKVTKSKEPKENKENKTPRENTKSNDCEAKTLAETYMRKYFPDFYKKCTRGVVSEFFDYNQQINRMSWNINSGFISDPDGVRNKNADQVLKMIFNESPSA